MTDTVDVDALAEWLHDHGPSLASAKNASAWVTECGEKMVQAADALVALKAQLNTPELHDFSAGVVSEAQHQRARWGNDHGAGKENSDWFWLVGYLAGKALTAANAGNHEKALHHCISTAAALANWHAALTGVHTAMRPGIDGEAALEDRP